MTSRWARRCSVSGWDDAGRRGDRPDLLPGPTAAFSRRDTLRPGFADAVAAVRRPASSRSSAFPAAGSRRTTRAAWSSTTCAGSAARTSTWTDASRSTPGQVVDVLTARGVDARVGEVPGEYCPGEFTVNGGGRIKLAGSAQRLTRDGWLFSTVLQVTGAAALRAPFVEASEALGYASTSTPSAPSRTCAPAPRCERSRDALLRLVEDRGADVVTDPSGHAPDRRRGDRDGQPGRGAHPRRDH